MYRWHLQPLLLKLLGTNLACEELAALTGSPPSPPPDADPPPTESSAAGQEQVVPFLLYVSLSIPAAINSFLILCIDLGTEIGPALSFAWEAAEVS